jgi:hypothetical protein
MKKIYYLLVVICLNVFVFSNSYSQTKAVITIDEITETQEGVLIIKYSLSNFKSNELFDIRLNVRKGYETINPVSVTGDIGVNVDGNGTKTIEWDLLKDNIILNEYVDVQLIANAREDISQLSMTGLFLSSTIMPGTGLMKLDRTQNYKKMGYFGYSFIGSAILFNVFANNSYNNYLSETDIDLRQGYYSKASTFRLITNVSVFSAASIWIGDYLWLYFKKVNLDKKYSFFDTKNNFRIVTSYNTLANKPMLNLQWYF